MSLQRVSRQSDRWFGITTTLMSRPQSAQEPDLIVANRAYEEAMTDYERLREDVLKVRDVRRTEYQRVMTLGQVAIVAVGLLSMGAVLVSTKLLASRIQRPLTALGDVVSRHQHGYTDAKRRSTEELRKFRRSRRRSTAWLKPLMSPTGISVRTCRWRGSSVWSPTSWLLR